MKVHSTGHIEEGVNFNERPHDNSSRTNSGGKTMKLYTNLIIEVKAFDHHGNTVTLQWLDVPETDGVSKTVFRLTLYFTQMISIMYTLDKYNYYYR